MISEKDKKQAEKWIEEIHNLDLKDDKIVKKILNGSHNEGDMRRQDIRTEKKYLKNKLELLTGINYDFSKKVRKNER